MTQLVKDSSWRTLRRKVVVGASSLALVAGMGVALAPAANAATPGSATIEVTGATATDPFPAETLADGTPSTGAYKVTNKIGADLVADAGNEFALRVTASGTNFGYFVQTAAPSLGDYALTFEAAGVAGVDVDVDLGNGSTVNNNDSVTTVTQVAAASDILKAAGLSKDLDLVATGGWTGKLDLTVSLIERTTAAPNSLKKVIASASFSTTVGTDADAVFFDDTVPANDAAAVRSLTATLNSDFSANLVKTPSFPSGALNPTNETGAVWTAPTGTSTVGTFKDTAGNVFSFDTATGKLTAVAAGVTKLTNTANPAVSFKLTSGANNVTVTLNVGFKDDASIASTLKANVYAAVNDGIIEGYEDGSFKPVANVSRQAFAAFAARYLNKYAGKSLETSANMMCDASNPSKFKDVANNAPFCAVIRDLAATGVTSGYADGTFKPAAPISRQAIAAMLFRIDNLQKGLNVNTAAPTPTTASFTDVAVSAPFAAEIYWAKGNGLVTGWTDNTFRPTNATSRQATAVFFTRLKTL